MGRDTNKDVVNLHFRDFLNFSPDITSLLILPVPEWQVKGGYNVALAAKSIYWLTAEELKEAVSEKVQELMMRRHSDLGEAPSLRDVYTIALSPHHQL